MFANKINALEIRCLEDLLPTTKREICGFALQLASELNSTNSEALCNAYITWAGKRSVRAGLFNFINPNEKITANDTEYDKYSIIVLGGVCVDLNAGGLVLDTVSHINSLQGQNNNNLELTEGSFYYDANGQQIMPNLEDVSNYLDNCTLDLDNQTRKIYCKDQAEHLLDLLNNNALHLGLDDKGKFTFFGKLKSFLEFHNYYSGLLTLEREGQAEISLGGQDRTTRLCLLLLDDYCIIKLHENLEIHETTTFLNKIMNRNEGVEVNLKHSVIPNLNRTKSITPTTDYIVKVFDLQIL